jgi:hypothetical protein
MSSGLSIGNSAHGRRGEEEREGGGAGDLGGFLKVLDDGEADDLFADREGQLCQ